MDRLPVKSRSLTENSTRSRRTVEEPLQRKSPPNIPKKELSPRYTEYKAFENIDTLNQVMLNYMDIESILDLYRSDSRIFDEPSVLFTLTKRFGLPTAKSFKEFLQSYDMTYATVRSYRYKNRTQKQVFIQAVKEGNLQAVIDGLKMYEQLRRTHIYFKGLEYSTAFYHDEIFQLFIYLYDELVEKEYVEILEKEKRNISKKLTNQDLEMLLLQKKKEDVLSRIEKLKENTIENGTELSKAYGELIAIQSEIRQKESKDNVVKHSENYISMRNDDKIRAILLGAAMGGRLDIIKEYPGRVSYNVGSLAKTAAKTGQIEVLKYLNQQHGEAFMEAELMEASGKGGNDKVIQYLISQGMDDYKDLVLQAFEYGHLDIVEKYFSQSGLKHSRLLREGIKDGMASKVEFVLKHFIPKHKQLNEYLKDVIYKLDVIEPRLKNLKYRGRAKDLVIVEQYNTIIDLLIAAGADESLLNVKHEESDSEEIVED